MVSQGLLCVMTKILILGGSAEATQLAQRLAELGFAAVFSYAGRVQALAPQPVPTRVGGFGGVAGLVTYLQDAQISHVIDATHPFAAQISQHAVTACTQLGLPLLAFTRPPWQPEAGDHWHPVANVATAVAALAGPAQRVFLALGRLQLPHFVAQPQHHYLLRLIEPLSTPLDVPHQHTVLARGPFALADELALLQAHRIERLVCKNSGGEGARAKLLAARQLQLPVLMIQRPKPLPRTEVYTLEAVLTWLAHEADLGV